tara:strand:+ start:452 stop:754 length:303 start_codon:yes stop_codon:yes gene_type:complete
MQIYGIDILGALTNPVGAITTVATGLLLFKGYKILNDILKPVSYISKLYELADTVVLNLDNRLVDKIRSKKVKDNIQKDIRQVLRNRVMKIEALILRISD